MSTLTVGLGARSYKIHVKSGALAHLSHYLPEDASSVIVVTDKTVIKLHDTLLHKTLKDAEWIVLPAGEPTKSFRHYQTLCRKILAQRIDRHAVLVAIGGGVIGDLTGFAAATLLRGIRYMQVPTTLLAQVDSSVGGKTGINSEHGKNLIGSFYQPHAVVIDPTVLDTLPRTQFLSGYAEVIKYALIRDRRFFRWLQKNSSAVLQKDHDSLTHAIHQSCKQKADIVGKDERESGPRMLLNFGHTFGHAFEALNHYKPNLPHGLAVAVGMSLATEISAESGLCSDDTLRMTREHFLSMGLPTHISDLDLPRFTADDVMAAMGNDKKKKAGRVQFIMTRGIGRAFVTDQVDPALVRRIVHDSINNV